MTIYDAIFEAAAARIERIFAQAAGRVALIGKGEGWRLRGRPYDPQRPSVRKDTVLDVIIYNRLNDGRPLGATGYRCSACGVVTYGWALACGKCGVRR